MFALKESAGDDGTGFGGADNIFAPAAPGAAVDIPLEMSTTPPAGDNLDIFA